MGASPSRLFHAFVQFVRGSELSAMKEKRMLFLTHLFSLTVFKLRDYSLTTELTTQPSLTGIVDEN
jgi:hypothetical protein